ncbi:protein translocase subunit SecD [Abditibacteriota bacterium]|nr:protein translocase subunit SecD [Abditibacteriota bacterium]
MKRRPVQYLGLLLLLLASLGVIFFPIGSKPVGSTLQVPVVAPKPFTQLVAKGKTAAAEADDAFVKAFKGQILPGTLTIGEDGKSATITDTAPGDTREATQARADKIVAALNTKFKGVQLAPSWQQTVAALSEKPLFALGSYAVYPPRQRDGHTIPAIKLGLDLQGGVNLVLQIRRASFPYRLASPPKTPAAREEILSKIRSGLGSSETGLGLRGTDVAFSTVKGSENQFEIRTQAKDKAQFDQQKAALDKLVKTALAGTATPGRAQFYDAQDNGKQLGFSGNDYSSQLLSRTVEILRHRVDKLGVSEPLIQAQPPDRVTVQLPGVNDPKKAVDAVGQTAQMQIVLLPQDLHAQPDPSDPNNTLFLNSKGDLVSGAEALELCQAETGRTLQKLGIDKTGAPQPIVSGQDVKPTTTAAFAEGGAPAIFFELQGEGSEKFAAVTRDVAGKGRQIPIFLDEKCISAPNVQSAITGGSGQISGGFKNVEEARGFALLLNSGALPAPIDVVENRTVSATLGNDSLVKSLQAGLIGLAVVAVFMIAFYRIPGILANCALAVYMVLNLAAFVLIGGTLTLPGIAGFLLALAMSLDTNILVFERLKEEMAIQPTFAAALRAAFDRAWTAILDSHITTLIASVVLFYFGTGPVKGFALTLGVGVLLSLFSAISVTRLFMWSVAKFGESNRGLMAGKLPAPHTAASSKGARA